MEEWRAALVGAADFLFSLCCVICLMAGCIITFKAPYVPCSQQLLQVVVFGREGLLRRVFRDSLLC